VYEPSASGMMTTLGLARCEPDRRDPVEQVHLLGHDLRPLVPQAEVPDHRGELLEVVRDDHPRVLVVRPTVEQLMEGQRVPRSFVSLMLLNRSRTVSGRGAFGDAVIDA